MSKVKTIRLKNMMAVSEFEANFNGCTAIVTAGNNKGKSTLLRGIINRIRGIRPDLIVRQGETEGTGEIELTTGEKFVWEFDTEGEDKLTFFTSDGHKTKVTRELANRFFPQAFDIDKFLNSPPREQDKQLQKAVGLDFTEIDGRFQQAYDDRTAKNKEAERFHVKLSEMMVCERVEFVDTAALSAQKEAERTRLNELYTANKNINTAARTKWNGEKDAINQAVNEHNIKASQRDSQRTTIINHIAALFEFGYEQSDALKEWMEGKYPKIETRKAVYPPEPEYVDELPDDQLLQDIDTKLLKASEINTRAQAYADYVAYKYTVEAAKEEALAADELVESIRQERRDMIASANMPTGITFAEEGHGVVVDGFPLDKNQISTSRMYTAALRIASIKLGEVESLHFDASFLDKNTFGEIRDWAKSCGLQLLVERADFEAGEMRYEILED
jgi:hypothetical protein